MVMMIMYRNGKTLLLFNKTKLLSTFSDCLDAYVKCLFLFLVTKQSCSLIVFAVKHKHMYNRHSVRYSRIQVELRASIAQHRVWQNERTRLFVHFFSFRPLFEVSRSRSRNKRNIWNEHKSYWIFKGWIKWASISTIFFFNLIK